MIDSATISDFIVSNVDGDFHKKKELKISSLKLVDITKRKNPYLFKAKGMNNASDLIKSIMDATVSSGEELSLVISWRKLQFLHALKH